MIELSGLVKRYGGHTVVDGVSLSVAKGELLVLLGESGSGKTTTLKMVNRLVEPTAGTVRIDGRDTASIPGFELRRRIGYVFQKIGLFPHLTIAENVAVTPRLLGWPEEKIRARVDELLSLVELDPGVGGRRPSELSGGQQQRVGVARALAAEPPVMLLDEPFGALDPLTRDKLQEAFRSLRARLGFTAMFVTHDMAEALLLGDRIAVMREGRLVQVGTPRELVESPADEYVAGLLGTPRRQAESLGAIFRKGVA